MKPKRRLLESIRLFWDLHWVKLNVEKQTERQAGPKAVLGTLQYYRYW